MLSVYAEILEEERLVATLSQKTDFGEWVKWENAMAVNLRWEHLLNKSDSYLKFVLCATEDVLPTPSVLKVWKQWNANDGKCPLGCGRAGSLKHILTGCEIAHNEKPQNRIKWRHDSILFTIYTAVL